MLAWCRSSVPGRVQALSDPAPVVSVFLLTLLPRVCKLVAAVADTVSISKQEAREKG